VSDRRFDLAALVAPAIFVVVCIAAGTSLESYPQYALALAMVSMIIGVALVVLVGLARCITLASGSIMAIGAYASTLSMRHLGVPYATALLLAMTALRW
jgi:branched-chain amino acid transport system permease protein